MKKRPVNKRIQITGNPNDMVLVTELRSIFNQNTTLWLNYKAKHNLTTIWSNGIGYVRGVKVVNEYKKESINELAFEIMHTEDLGTIHALANRIYLASLHDDLTINEDK